MKLLLDVTSLMRRDLTGIGVYVKSLLDHLRAEPGVELRGCWRLDRFRKRDDLPHHITENVGPYIPILSALNMSGYQLFHGPDFRIPKRGRFRKVVTIHDLVIREEGLVDERFAREGIAKMERTLFECRPDRIITVSAFTRTKLLEHYPALEPITHAIPLGVDAAKFGGPIGEHQIERVRALSPGPYLLSVGSVEKRKNLAGSIRAFELLRGSHRDLTLLIAGGAGHGVEEIDAMIAASPAAGAIRRLGFVDDALLVALYRHAACFLYPSLYEGFGLPILEAMAAGAPVVTSDRGAMAEAAGDAALLADPTLPDDIAARIALLLDDEDRRERCVHAGRERAAEFTWKRTATETLEVYRDAIDP